MPVWVTNLNYLPQAWSLCALWNNRNKSICSLCLLQRFLNCECGRHLRPGEEILGAGSCMSGFCSACYLHELAVVGRRLGGDSGCRVPHEPAVVVWPQITILEMKAAVSMVFIPRRCKFFMRVEFLSVKCQNPSVYQFVEGITME